uniref:Uncharacterized protein n=1 Tax=Ciona intestinalis TaxID=7719 RepID=H2XMJ1_CIOIN
MEGWWALFGGRRGKMGQSLMVYERVVWTASKDNRRWRGFHVG